MQAHPTLQQARRDEAICQLMTSWYQCRPCLCDASQAKCEGDEVSLPGAQAGQQFEVLWAY